MNSEFTVILLAGGSGSRMYPLTEGLPKSLLPVANRPLISYQLEFLSRAGFSEVIIVLNSEDAPEIQKYVQEISKARIKIVFEVTKGRVGTAEAILRLKSKIQTDFIVISGDVIVTEDFIHTLADIHRAKDAAVTMLLKKKPPPTEEQKAAAKSSDNNEPADFIGLADGRVVFFANTADVEENLHLHKSLLKVYHNITIHKNLLDAHVYIFSRWTLGVLEKYEKDIGSLKGEFIPFLVKLQLQKKDPKGAIPEQVLNIETIATAMSSSTATNTDGLGIFCYVMEDGYCIRVNTLLNYFEANKDVARGATTYNPYEEVGKQNFISASAEVNPKTQVGPDCVVGEGTKIGEKCSVKKSNIGKHCNIAANVKIINSVIMDHVTIMEKCTIQNALICNNVHIGESVNLKDCQVGTSYNFEAKGDFKNESFVASDE